MSIDTYLEKNHEDLLAAIIGYELLLALVVMFFIHYVENLARKQTCAVYPLLVGGGCQYVL
jgi:hypothetical protein